MTVGILRHPDFLLHENGPGHPERRERLHAVDSALRRFAGTETAPISPRPARREELELVHQGAYLDQLVASRTRNITVFDADTSANRHSYDVALLAAGGAIEAVFAALDGTFPRSFVFARPPGHHAEANRAMGFCLLNNAAVAAAAALERGLERVAIVDWDVHHGNGTEHIFAARRDVLYISIHEYPHYPGTGAASDTGIGVGEGYTLNIPLPAGSTDADYLDVADAVVLPALREYRPQLVIVSAGFDTHVLDPLSGMRVTGEGYRGLTRRLLDAADISADGRVVHLLEGGYDLRGIADGVEGVMEVLTDTHPLDAGTGD